VGAYLRNELGRTLLTLAGVALGVAVLVAIDLANESALASFRQTMGEVSGEAQLTVRGNGAGLPGSMVRTLGSDPAIDAAEPLISGTATLLGTERFEPRTITLIGTDFLGSERRSNRAVRDLSFELAEGLEFREFLIDPSLIVVPKLLLQRTGLKLGESAEFEIAGTRRTLRIGGAIEAGPYTDALDGNLAVMEIGLLDTLLARGGTIDRVDLILAEGTSVEQVADRLQRELPGSVLVERPETRNRQVDEMLAAFRFNLRALGHISILVGAFLIYNAMSVAVARRRPVIGTLRAMGVSAATVRGVFLAEGFLFGVVAALIGVPMGMLMALAMLETVSTAISINFVETNARGLAADPGIIFFAAGMGILGSVLAALRPAMDAAGTPPANTMRVGSTGRQGGLWSHHLLPAVGLTLGGLLLLARQPSQGIPLIGYTATVLFVGAFVMLAKPAVMLISRVARLPFRRLFGAEGLLAVSTIAAMPGRAAVAVCGLLISLGMTISVTVMVSSFRTTVIDWMEQVLLADLYISPAVTDGRRRPDPFPGAVVVELEKIPGVAAVDPFRVRPFVLYGKPANLGAGSLETARFGNSVLDGRPTEVAMREARVAGDVVVSEALARKHELEVGDSIAIPTPSGEKSYRIGAVYTDFSSEQGYVIMDRAEYLRLFNDPLIDNMAIYLEPGADRRAVAEEVARILAATPDIPPMAVRANTDLRAFALEAFDRTFAVTTVLKVIAIVVSILGVAATLLAQVLDRRQEILTLRTIGASLRRVVVIILLEALLVGITGVLLGIAAGLVMSWVLTRVIMLESFGWTIGFSVPELEVVQAGLLVLACTLMAAILPAREAIRTMKGTSATAR